MNLTQYSVRPNVLKNEAQVWWCNPEKITDKERLSYYKSLLSVDETAQYRRFQDKKGQHTYLVSHALVRTALSQYADLEPHQWQFYKNEHGKPEINLSSSTTPLKFNLTHTQGLCACVVTNGILCGIDVETLNRNNDLFKIAQRMFADTEVAVLKELDGAQFRKAFSNFWTLRESYVKALGTGLSGSSKDFHFSIADNAVEISYKNPENDSNEEEKQWQFELLEPTSEHVLAIALNTSELGRLSLVIKTGLP